MKSLTDLTTEYLDHLRAQRFSQETIRKRKWHLSLFSRWMKERCNVDTVDRLRGEYLRRWHAWFTSAKTRQGHPYSVSEVNGRIGALRSFLRYLGRCGYVRRDLVDQVPTVKKPKLLPGSVLTHAQMRKLLSRISTDSPEGYRNRAMLELLYSTGIRVGELLSLDVEHVDFTNHTMTVTGKGDKQRVVPIGRTALKYLESYVVAVRPFIVRDSSERALFINQRGWRLRYARFLDALRACVQGAKLDVRVTPHTFRRSCTTELIRSGANMYHVKELLGHESLDTLKHYARLTINDLKKTHEKCHPRERDDLP